MILSSGTRLGHYEVLSKLGEGGMGEVYRARDTRLKRDVALKVLPADVAGDIERLARFQREAEVLASLNHPHIAHIHGVEESNGTTALIMELVEGEDLAHRIARGPIPIDDALPIAQQIADALEAAHEQGIIHRDLKPANIKVRPDGMVKVLDFGLAKALDTKARSAAAEPTITSPAMTMRGMILGTASYMAPEQAKGKAIDRRADVWAFGAVLYEMLSGRRAFVGEDVTDTIVAVVSREPDWAALPANTPVTIHKLVRRCLEKDRKRRLDSAADARLEIEDALSAPLTIATPVPDANTGAARLPWALVAMLGLTLVAGLIMWAPWQPSLVLPEARLDIVTPGTDKPTSFALSPDGRHVVFVASSDGASRLWVRPLATTTAQPLPGTEGATAPFWSPDSRSIAFYAANALKRIDLGGGAPQILAEAGTFRGGTWCADGVILYAPSAIGPLWRVSATGGTPAMLPMPDARHQSHRWPQVLPDGRRFLFYAVGPPDTKGIYLGALDGAAPIRLTTADSSGVYLSDGPGWLLWVRGGALVAQRLDAASGTLMGEPLSVADAVLVDDVLSQSALSVASTGAIAFRLGAANRRQLTWFDRSGTSRGNWGEPDSSSMRNLNLSPDGTRLAVSRTEQGNEDVWLLDGARMTRLTFDQANDAYPVWSPDGRRVAFRSNRKGVGDIFVKLTSAGSAEEPVDLSDQSRTPVSWSPDGRFLMHFTVGAQFNYDLWATPMAGQSRTPSPVVATPFREMWSTFSPDGRWVAYMSDQSGRYEIYLRPFLAPSAAHPADAAEGQWQVSTSGGGFPVWRRDGKELYYLTAKGELMAATVTVVGNTLQPGVPVKLFATRIAGGGAEVGVGRQYDVAPDGRFLINTELDDVSEPIRLLLNWHPDAKKSGP